MQNALVENEVFISVDIETAGPIPAEYSLLSIGACVTAEPSKRFQCDLKPVSNAFDPQALKVTGLSLERLATEGFAPKDAMSRFAQWLSSVCPNQQRPIFVGLNAPFDWSFVNYYFHKFYGSNPFGISALDIKSLYMGTFRSSWRQTSGAKMASKLQPSSRPNHCAIDDAIFQAEIFELIRKLPPAI